MRGSGAASGQDEILERGQRVIEVVENLLELRDLLCLHDLRAWNAELTAEIEEVVLDIGEAASHFARQTWHAQDDADRAVGLIDGAIGRDACVILGYAPAISEAGGAVVAGTRRDLCESVAHGCLLWLLRVRFVEC